MNEEIAAQAEETPATEATPVVDQAAPEAPAKEAAPVETPLEDSTPSEGTQPEEDKPKKKGGFQRRIDELTRQKYDEQQRAQVLQAELDQVRRQSVQASHESQRPALEQYNSEEEYEQAMGQWVQSGYQRQVDEAQQAYSHQQQQQAQMSQAQAVQEKIAKATEKYPDFQERITDPSIPKLSQINLTAYEAVLESDNMADVAMYLCQNPAEIYAFSQMTPIQAVKAVARMEAKVTSTPTVAKPPPAPPSDIGGKSEAKSLGLYDPNLTTDEWMALDKKLSNAK